MENKKENIKAIEDDDDGVTMGNPFEDLLEEVEIYDDEDELDQQDDQQKNRKSNGGNDEDDGEFDVLEWLWGF